MEREGVDVALASPMPMVDRQHVALPDSSESHCSMRPVRRCSGIDGRPYDELVLQGPSLAALNLVFQERYGQAILACPASNA